MAGQGNLIRVTDPDFTPEKLAIARTLAADASGAEVISAWRNEGIEAILLKGATLATWLYPTESRTYGDTDLLVAPPELCQAVGVLRRLGFAPYEYHVSLHSHPWIRETDGATVDLHVNLWGPGRPADRVWRDLQGWLVPTRLAGASVLTLNLPARALYVALHAAQHQAEGGKPLDDLRRALELTPITVWRQAEQLADRVGVLGPMAAGLLLQPGGQQVIDHLPLVRACLLAEREDVPLAIGFARFAHARGTGAKLRVVLASLSRPPDEYGPDRPDAPVAGLSLGTRIRHSLYLARSAGRTVAALWRGRRRR